MLLLEPLPGGARWAAAMGSLLLVAFAVQVVTGILLAMNYAPSEKTAWESVNYIQNEAPLGSFIRAVHHWGSGAMVVLLLVHLIQVFVWGAYKRPRELTWMVGVLLLFLTLGLAFTGYLLPWDQKAYWATKVGMGIVGTVPFVGDGLRTLLQGGDQMGNLTLTRFFTLHGFILPGLIVLLVVVHLYLFRRHGVTPPLWCTPEQLKAKEEPFWPKQVLKDGVLALVFFLALGVWAYCRPAPLEERADPSKLYEARPEWYFMFLFQLLSYFKGPYEVVGTFVLPSVFFLILFFWPFLDRSPHRNPLRRPLAMGALTLGTVGLVGLTVFAIATDVRMHEPAQAVAAAPTPAEPAGPIQQMDLPKLYATHCQACHGVDGRPPETVRAAMKNVPDFSSPAWQEAQTNLEITHRVMDGNGPLMPPFRDKLTKDQVIGLTIYVRAFAIESGAPAPKTDEGPPKEPTKGPPPPLTASNMPGEKMYRDYCMSCHGYKGDGATVRQIPDKEMQKIPDFTLPEWQKAHADDAELRASILDGKGKFMAPMKDKLAKEDVAKLVAVVRSFGEGKLVKEEPKTPPEPPPDVPKPEPGVKPPPPKEPGAFDEDRAARIRAASVIYRESCLNCHGKDGRGLELKTVMPAIPDFTSRTWQQSRNNPQLKESILHGKGTLMPAFDGRVDPDQAKSLIAYVRALGPDLPAAEAPPQSGDFEERYRRLQEEWDALQKQLDELSKQPKKP
jgi:quinol-cytochrome oxidoreductase complex cytochrome b subunit/cytochrome c